MSELKDLQDAIENLELVKQCLVEALNFDQFSSGYGAETYAETIDKLTKGIVDYINEQ